MECIRCQAETATGVHLCHACTTRLEEVLGRVPEALSDAEITVARLDRTGKSGRSTSTPGSPVNLEASERATHLREIAGSWARMVLEHEDRDDLRNVEPVAYLRMSVHIIRANDWAGELLDELDEALTAVLRAVDLPPEIRTYGTCKIVLDELRGIQCGGTIRGVKSNRIARCRECGEAYDAHALRSAKVEDSWSEKAPLATIVKALNLAGVPLKLATAKRWAERDHLTTPWVNDQGVKVYTMGQVMDVVKAMAQTRRKAG